ncbi:hypothetical protein M9H77_04477 [Catharanthus roseus]|uniref:Uncharacterized protein n=1 Tax=Catharanthus roseus TaxID=4058 RepID=A0ACC0CEP0_CATRO|nr:hypothetical protein M9H77_04477 [Catharanthus roseus]
MNIGWWNVRGFSKALKHKEVNRFLKDNNIAVFALLEMKLEEGKLFDIVTCKFKDWKFGSNLKQPRLIFGDLNSILNGNERRGRSSVFSYEVREFMNCCVDLGLVDVNSRGSYFTWTNNNTRSIIDSYV